MQLPSLLFIFYCLPVLLAVYFLLSFSRRLQNYWLLAASLALYAWGEPAFVLALLLSVLVNWSLGRAITDPDREKARSALVAAVVFNLVLLFFSKYLGLVISTINYLFNAHLPGPAPESFPLGVSFFTLQAISYAMDLYHREAETADGPASLGLYLAFFPIQAAGPLPLYRDIAGQLWSRKANWPLFASGCRRFIIGLAKNVLLAGSLGQVADHVFTLSSLSPAATVPVLLALLGLVAFGLHFYYYLSGCADMAIGLGRFFGFELKENFNEPYTASSLTDFWRRWNISVITWFNIYLLAPLRQRRGPVQPGAPEANNHVFGRDILTVWVLFGLWNGAEWTFCLWGALHGFFLLVENVARLDRRPGFGFFKHLYTLAFVTVTWSFFRADNLTNAMTYLKNLFMLNNNGFFSDLTVILLKETWLYFLAALFFCLPISRWLNERPQNGALAVIFDGFRVLAPFILVALYLLTIVYLVQAGFQAAPGLEVGP